MIMFGAALLVMISIIAIALALGLAVWLIVHVARKGTKSNAAS